MEMTTEVILSLRRMGSLMARLFQWITYPAASEIGVACSGPAPPVLGVWLVAGARGVIGRNLTRIPRKVWIRGDNG